MKANTIEEEENILASQIYCNYNFLIGRMFFLKIYNVNKLKRNDIRSQLLLYHMTGRHDSVSLYLSPDPFLQLSILISPFHSVVFTILQSERNFFLEKGLLSYMFQALIGELVV
jgi:hypothetical protein